MVAATDTGNDRLEAWERRWEWPLTVLAAAFLGAYAWPVLDPGLDASLTALCTVIDVVAWSAFFVDYAVRVHLAERRAHFVWGHLPDLAVLVLPILRPLRLLRLVLLLRMLNRGATQGLRGRIAVYVAGATALLLTCSALAVLDAERAAADANITTFGDALWWSLTTITTVGYGDHYPVTTEGRWVAAGLMLGGVALLGIVTASIASWLIERVRETEEEAQAVTRADFRALTAEIAELRAQLTGRTAPPPPTG
ncbi:MAG TPA: potassium channel family protein [Jatrophihabitans sp.]|jgi:voltage-gated potassium channel|uniref:potassium channel family protein n=1 Tax=Jatrophihabitans sp. TaxID=1932789 RepID=UPI002DFBFF80|nr:potassium channel family protein [Jatrophihabitans sp.]